MSGSTATWPPHLQHTAALLRRRERLESLTSIGQGVAQATVDTIASGRAVEAASETARETFSRFVTSAGVESGSLDSRLAMEGFEAALVAAIGPLDAIDNSDTNGELE